MKCSFHFCSLSSWLAAFNLFSRYSSFRLFHLLSAILIVIVYLLLSFWYYWFGFECILVVLFWYALILSGFLKCLRIGISWVSFIKQGFFNVVSFFLNCYWLPWNFAFDSWFGLYVLCCYFHMGSKKVFIFVIRSISFRCFLKSNKFVSYSWRRLISCITISEWGPVISWGFNFLILISA